MSKKIRTKKNNKIKRESRALSVVRLWSWESMLEEGGATVSHGEVRLGCVWKQLSQEQVTKISSGPRNWAICCRALCRIDEPEEIWLETSLRSIKDVKVNDLEQMYSEMRQDVMDTLEEDGHLDKVVDCGWMLVSFPKNDVIDSGFESKHIGQVNKNRHMLWLQSQDPVTD